MTNEQQALNTLKENGYTNHFQPIKLYQQYPNEFKILQELIDQQHRHTLLECIKEWENRGWKIEILKDEKNLDTDVFGTKQQSKYCWEMFKISAKLKVISLDGVFTLGMIHLLLKTLKALEDNNDT